MNIKGTKTEENLWNAFSGESQTRNKYMFFAKIAEQEGLNDIADAFKKTAGEEESHANTIFSFLNGVKDTKSNLQSAIQGENYEWTTMYDEYKRVAKEEGFPEVAKFFEEVIKIERAHEERFVEIIKNISNK